MTRPKATFCLAGLRADAANDAGRKQVGETHSKVQTTHLRTKATIPRRAAPMPCAAAPRRSHRPGHQLVTTLVATANVLSRAVLREFGGSE